MADKGELKAGHPPAVKAGGKRIVSKHRPQEADSDAYDDKYLEQLPETPSLMIGRAGSDIPVVEGVKVDNKAEMQKTQVHHKPQPQHEKFSPNKPMNINQPRKQ